MGAFVLLWFDCNCCDEFKVGWLRWFGHYCVMFWLFCGCWVVVDCVFVSFRLGYGGGLVGWITWFGFSVRVLLVGVVLG